MAEQALSASLDIYLTTQVGVPFDWDTHNCCHFVGGWVQVAEGLNPLAALPLANMRAMLRAVQEFGCLAEAITHQLGREPIAPADAALGDVVLMPLSVFGSAAGRYSVGICVGASAALPAERVAVFITEEGSSVWWPVRDAVAAWRVGAP